MGTCCHCICYTEFMAVVNVLKFLTHVHKSKLLLWLQTICLYQRLDRGKRERNSIPNKRCWGSYLVPCLKKWLHMERYIASSRPGSVTKYNFKYMQWVSIMNGCSIGCNSRMADLGKNHILHLLYSVLLWLMKVLPATGHL